MKREIFLSTEEYQNMDIDQLIDHSKKLQRIYKRGKNGKLTMNMLKLHYKEIVYLIEEKLFQE